MVITHQNYEVWCPNCRTDIGFSVNDVAGLADDIDGDIDNAIKETRDEVEREFDGMVDPSDLPISPQTIHDLAAAIENGDRMESRHLLSLIASDLGLRHSQAAEIGRFAKNKGGVRDA